MARQLQSFFQMISVFTLKMLLRISLYLFCCGISMAQAVLRLPYPNDCQRYYEKSMMSCPPNFLWNDLLKRCEIQTLGGCVSNDSSLVSTSPPDTEDLSLSAICDNKLGQLIPYPGDCTRFIHCDYLPFAKTCPQYLFWNSLLLTCDKICV